MIVLFWTFVYDMLIYYKTWIYHCLIKQVKSLSICSRTSNSVRIRQSGLIGNRGVTISMSTGGDSIPIDDLCRSTNTFDLPQFSNGEDSSSTSQF